MHRVCAGADLLPPVSAKERTQSRVTVLDDEEGEIRRAYGESGSSAYLVRPDGHLAAWIPLKRAETVDALPGLQAIAIGG